MRYQLRIGAFLTCLVTLSGAALAQALPPAPASAPPAHLTLDDVRRITLQNHPQVREAQSAADAATQRTVEAKSAYYPQLSGNLTGVEALAGSRLAAGALNNPIIFNRFAAGADMTQLVTDFGRTTNLVGSAKAQAQAAQSDVNTTRENVLLAAEQAFYSALRAQAELAVAQQTVQERQTVADQITTLEQNKIKSGLDVTFADVNLDQAKLLLVQAQNDLQAAYATLSRALGFGGPQRFDLVEPAEPSAQLPTLDAVIAAAETNRPELVAQKLRVQSAQRFAIAERDLQLPTLSLAGAAGEVPFRQTEIDQSYAAAGFDLNIPIFNGRLFSARHAEAQAAQRQEEATLTDEQEQVERDVQVAWLAAGTAAQNLALTAELLAEANKALDLAQQRYNLGLGNIVELSQAQLNQTQASIAQASAKYDYDTRLAELAYQEGTLQ
jgi:outer membrane protein